MKLLVALMAAGLVFTSCDQPNSKSGKSKAVNETNANSYMDAMEFLRAKKEYTKLVEIIEANGLQDEFMKEEDSTIFAPTNKGFATISESNFDALLKNKAIAERIIKHHIVKGKLNNEALKAKDEVVTKLGETVPVKKTNFGGLAEADVVSPNNGFKYGFVHGINRVLMPLGEAKPDEKFPDEKVPDEQQQEQGKVPDEQQQEQGKVPDEQQQEQGKVPDEQQQEQEQQQDEKFPDEKVPDEKFPDEKVPDEKVPDEQQQEQGKVPDEQQQEQQEQQQHEKFPDEKVPDEKFPDEKVPDEKFPDEKVPDEKVPDEQQQEQGKIPDEQQQEQQQEQGQEQGQDQQQD
ncbi:MAG: fasciclin domain-containing protein [Bacteriovoracaceae bacterium]|nr:fasciclin domain-containing protein [Bacteriovoracaceae bacterium]